MLVHVSTLHPRDDARIVVREIGTLTKLYGSTVALVVADGLGNEVVHLNGSTFQIHDIGVNVRGRGYRASVFQWRCFRAVASLKPELVHFHDPELVFLGLLMKLQSAKVIYDAHEHWPNQILAKDWVNPSLRKFVAFLAAKFDTTMSHFFDAVVCATPEIEKRFGGRLTGVLLNYPLREEFRSTPQKNRENEFFRMVYIGGIAIDRGIKQMIEVAGVLSERGRQVELCIAGQWDTSLLEECSRLNGWQQTLILNRINRVEVLDLLASSDVGFLLLDPTPNHLECMPVKLFEYCGAGLPTIASNFPKMKFLVEEKQIGLIVDHRDVLAISSAVETLIEDSILSQKFSTNARNLIDRSWNWESQEQSIKEIYEKVLKKQTS